MRYAEKSSKASRLACRLFVLVFVITSACTRSALEGAEPSETVDDHFSVHHVGMGVDSIEESLTWYQENLGFQFERSFRLEYIKSTVVFIRRDDFRLELFAFDDGRSVPDYRSDPAEDLRHGGISHVAFQVNDVREFAAKLEARGVRFTIPVTEFVAGNPVAFISDPSGNIIELYQAPGVQQ